MRRYDDPVEVRRGPIGERDGALAVQDGPEQFLWRGRLWKVSAVVAHWVETAPWWQSAGVRAVVGSDEVPADRSGAGAAAEAPADDLLVEREVWRVQAGRGRGDAADGTGGAGGVFDLSFDWTDGRWMLVGCVD